jgi:PTS system N-acetylgalactosamine-specific IIA component
MKNRIIIIGHHHYATGLLGAFEMIAGKNVDITAIDFEGDEDIAPTYQKLIKKYADDNILFICDLLGGTPYKEASKLAFAKPNVEVVIGCNLGSLLEISMIKDKLSIQELSKKIVLASQKNTSLFDKKEFKQRMKSKDEEI